MFVATRELGEFRTVQKKRPAGLPDLECDDDPQYAEAHPTRSYGTTADQALGRNGIECRLREPRLIAVNSKNQFLLALDRVPVVGILRGCPTEHIVEVGAAAASAGIAVLEVTFDSPALPSP